MRSKAVYIGEIPPSTLKTALEYDSAFVARTFSNCDEYGAERTLVLRYTWRWWNVRRVQALPMTTDHAGGDKATLCTGMDTPGNYFNVIVSLFGGLVVDFPFMQTVGSEVCVVFASYLF